eukprot:1806540-Lingulodinium_polyedra.AAC.1
MTRQALRTDTVLPEVAKAHNSVQPIHFHVSGPLVTDFVDRKACGIIWGNVEIKPGFLVYADPTPGN